MKKTACIVVAAALFISLSMCIVHFHAEADVATKVKNSPQMTLPTESPAAAVRTVYSSLAQAKAHCSGREGKIISTLGFYKAGDGGAADYVLREGLVANDVTIHATDGGQYLSLIIGDEINVLCAGLVADGEKETPTDNWFRLQSIADYDLFFPDGRYYVSAPVEIKRAVTWRGLHGKRNAKRAILVCDSNGIVINKRGATIDGVNVLSRQEKSDNIGIMVDEYNQYVTISNLFVQGFHWGVYLDDDCWGANISNCNFLSNKEALYIKNDANEVVVRECYFLANENGIHTVSSSVQNLVIRDCLFQDQKHAHLNVETQRGIVIYCSGCYFENHAGRGVVIGEKEHDGDKIDLITFVGDRFHFSVDENGCSEDGLYLGNVTNATITGCSFSKNVAVSHDYITAVNVDTLLEEGNYFRD